jgi:hypothetical protein
MLKSSLMMTKPAKASVRFATPTVRAARVYVPNSGVPTVRT